LKKIYVYLKNTDDTLEKIDATLEKLEAILQKIDTTWIKPISLRRRKKIRAVFSSLYRLLLPLKRSGSPTLLLEK
jgi:hypothetical protein